MFSYIRILIGIILIALITGMVLAGNSIRSTVVDYTLSPILEQDAKTFTKGYNKTIWSPNKEKQESEIFQESSTEYLKNAPFLKFLIYSDKSELLYNNGKRHLGMVEDSTFRKQLHETTRGKTTTILLHDTIYRNSKGERKIGDLLRVMVPLEDNGTSMSVSTVATILYDISYAKESLSTIQNTVIATVSSILLIIYVLFFIASRKAEFIIEEQNHVTQELVEAKKRAEAESEDKSKFLANVSHELRTPLNAIIGFSDIIKDQVMGPIGNDQYLEYIKDINHSGVHLLSLINDILDYSKAEAGKLEVDSIDVDLTKIIKNCMRLIATKAEEAKIQLLEEIPKEHIVITADPKRTKQVLLNLLSNAVKFTPDNGTVTLSAQTTESNMITVSVADTGIGISAKDISKAMSSFGQVDSSLSRRHDGTGLGLPFSRKLVEMMGGTFNIRSEDGLGTTVTVTFKASKDN